MTAIFTVTAVVLGAALFVAYALWDPRWLATFGCVVVRLVTFGRIRLSSDGDYSRALGIAAITLLVIFVSFVIIASHLH